VRVVTNYFIKAVLSADVLLLTPLYASSATWSLSSWNWWLAPILLVCGASSPTMDLVFDNSSWSAALLGRCDVRLRDVRVTT